ncbi:MAG TPA: hypothetical protein VFK54_07855 [Candidatus Limnocylindrales bacterium]|nr:hypothetical protein [Candidatus Limnocylindrales bacterium]
MSVERDVLERLATLDLAHYVTGSWALAVYAEPRMTRDIDVVVDMATADYESTVRPAFEHDFAVNEPLDLGGRWLGGLIHQVEIVRVDLVFGRTDAFARSAMDRRRLVDHPMLGVVPVIAPEDLVLAKLEWSEGTSELQLRDVRSIIRLQPALDWAYLEHYAAILGIRELLEGVRDG